MSRFLHARSWLRVAFSLALTCAAAAPGARTADARQAGRQQHQTAQEQEERRQDPEERVAGGDRLRHPDRIDPEATTLMLAPSRFEVDAGHRFRLTLTVLGAVDLQRLPVTIRFDPAVVELVSVGLGSAWGDGPQPILLHDATRPGELVVGLAQLDRDRPGISGFAELLDLEFHALRRGETALTLDRFAAISGGATTRTTTALAAEIIVR